MKTRTVIMALLALLLAGCGRKAVVREISVVPEPVFMVQKEGTFTLPGSPKLSVVGLGQNSGTVKYIMKSLRHSRMRPKLVSASRASDVELVLYDTVNPELGDEGYLLEVRGTGITVSANSERGIFYGFQTLMQMLPADVTSTVYSAVVLPECTILDYPRFEWRGVHLDVSRHFFPAKFVKKYLDVMAMYKMNKLHFELGIEASESGIAEDSLPALRDSSPEEGVAGGHYSPEELEDIMAYAADRGIEVIMDGRMPDSADLLVMSDEVVMSRRGLKPGMEAARAGRKVIMSPEEFCDLDCYQADRRYQPPSREGLITLRKAYEFDPAPMGTNLHVEANILGGRCNLWTGCISTAQQAEYMLLPRMLAISEALWSPRERRDWNGFRRKVEEQKERLGVRGYSYCEGSFTPQFTARRVDEKTMNIAISTEVPNTYIFYTTDRSTPTRESAIYLGPMNLSRGTHIKILPMYKDVERDSVYEFVIK